jgi:peptidoglycan/xylan/chitin deacetylase (PgdA/CDA1 family)
MLEIIEGQLDNELTTFYYPYGFYSNLSEALFKVLGVKSTVTIDVGLNTIEMGNPESLFKLKRYNIPDHFMVEVILNEVEEQMK